MKRDHLKETRKQKREREEKLHVFSSLKQACIRIDELEAHVEAIRKLKGAKSNLVISPREGTNTSEAVAVACATDWHLGCVVRPEQVSGFNTFNVAIAKKRITNFFERVVRMTRKERQDVKIHDLILFLGGDF